VRSKGSLLLRVALALGVAVAVLWVQWRFDVARARTGREIVEAYRAPASGRGLSDVIRGMHPGCDVRWTARTESACLDQVRVTAEVVPPSSSTGRYDFIVDVNTKQIAPGDDGARRAIEALAPAPSTSR
jgi:hypothetical protein